MNREKKVKSEEDREIDALINRSKVFANLALIAALVSTAMAVRASSYWPIVLLVIAGHLVAVYVRQISTAIVTESIKVNTLMTIAIIEILESEQP